MVPDPVPRNTHYGGVAHDQVAIYFRIPAILIKIIALSYLQVNHQYFVNIKGVIMIVYSV